MGQPATLEQTLIGIVRTLPPERAVELLDFARFLQTLGAKSEEDWDKLFAQPESQRAMLAMAREARQEFQTGRTTDIKLTDDGRLAPK